MRNHRRLFWALVIVLSCFSLMSLFVGVGEMTLISLWQGDRQSWSLFYSSRLPRLVAIILAGSGLSVAGLIMQQVSQNRFAAPSTSGTIESAMLGFVLSLIFFGNGNQLWLIFLTAIIGTATFLVLIQSIQFKNAIYVPLVGIIFGNVIGSAATFIAYKFDVIQSLAGWRVANFASILDGRYELLYLALPMVGLSYLYATRLSAVAMGQAFARNLGLNYRQVVALGVVLVCVSAVTVMMIVGELPFLGLIVPNLVAWKLGDNLKTNIPFTALSGALLVLICDVLGRVIHFPYEIPISLIISVFGGVVFVMFIVKGRHHER